MKVLITTDWYKPAINGVVTSVCNLWEELLEYQQKVEEVASYYPAGDLFVSASTSETQGLTYAEALAAGLPLLCRKDECLRAVVEEGKNGWQYRTEEEFLKDLKNWKEKNDDERRRMCSYAKHSAEMFSTKRFAGSVEQLYERQIEEKQTEREKQLAESGQYCILD